MKICIRNAEESDFPPPRATERFDIVFTNPPFDLPTDHLEHIINNYTLFKEYGYAGADVLFLERFSSFFWLIVLKGHL